MAIPIIGGQDVIVFKDPVSRNADAYRWWAERGLMHSENQRTGEYKSQTVRATLQRLQALQDMIRNSRASREYMHPEAINAYQDYIDRMIVLCQKANEQGMPDNAKHSKQKGEEWKAKRHSRLVVVPGLARGF